MAGAPIWYELMTPDPGAVSEFYRAVLGWEIPSAGHTMPGGSEYREMAAKAAQIFLEYGATRDLEAWGVDVPKDKRTDFYRSVDARDDESIVFSFVEWPDEAARNEGWKKVMEDDRMKPDMENMPFDGQRMYWGGFAPILAKAV
jgi:uncharacterized protein YbaA (DUF1428 family)